MQKTASKNIEPFNFDGLPKLADIQQFCVISIFVAEYGKYWEIWGNCTKMSHFQMIAPFLWIIDGKICLDVF